MFRIGAKVTAIFWMTLLIVSCETVEKDALTGENLWGQAGASAYPQAAKKMLRSSPVGTPLDLHEKEALRPVYGSLVDKVFIHWNSEPLDEITAQEVGIRFGSGSTLGQTYGHDIYIKGPKAEWTTWDRLEILTHELTHSVQFERLGSNLEAFGYDYFREYYLAGQVYEDNELEIEANNKATANIENIYKRYLELTGQSEQGFP